MKNYVIVHMCARTHARTHAHTHTQLKDKTDATHRDIDTCTHAECVHDQQLTAPMYLLQILPHTHKHVRDACLDKIHLHT